MNVTNLSYKHEKNHPYFFRNLSFNIELGKIHALSGKNGTGKSVLLNLLNGKCRPHSTLEGNINSLGKIRLLNQRFDELIADKFSFIQNLQFGCMNEYPSLIRTLSSSFLYLNLIENFNIDITKPVHVLSGGQRQILALLMILQKPVKVLLLDEPTATLDEENAVLVFDFLKILVKQGIAILVVCHDHDLINRYVTGECFCLEKKNDGLRTIKKF